MQSSLVSQQRNAQLLDILLRRPQKALRRFIFALVATDQEHLAQPLNPSLTEQYVIERDAQRTSGSEPGTSESQASSKDPSGTLVPSEHTATKQLG